ncbi:hypothetical protein [Salinarimonas soli]|uniref:Uncharacterized protein n=1 Tax=Salinarimonas soli TaxID=1638099 RepID=A0A5B2VC62_9HYPH|nr:hypothetical protein [Salinarimonas soli]KAA2236711.1 hypothetical protein F0L46_13160 [Salinarimonas soli]
MAQANPYRTARPQPALRAAETATGFKPVALPALAAALRQVRETQTVDAAARELPPILRKEAVLG